MTQPTLVPEHSISSTDRTTDELRADHLCALASRIERSIVMGLGSSGRSVVWTSPRSQLGDRLLERNLHQLHEAAEALRAHAFELRHNGHEVDAA